MSAFLPISRAQHPRGDGDEYGEEGRGHGQTDPHGLGGASSTYTHNGRSLAQTSSRGQNLASSYNANGWLTEQNVFNSSNTKTQSTLFSAYDRVGNNTAYQVQILTGTKYTNYYTTTYAKYDGYKESKVAGTSPTSWPATPSAATTSTATPPP